MTLKNSVTTAVLMAALALPVGAFAQTTTAPSPAAPPATAVPHAAAPAATVPAAAPHTLPATIQASRHMRDDQIRASKRSRLADAIRPIRRSAQSVSWCSADGKVADVVLGVLRLSRRRRSASPCDGRAEARQNDHLVLAATGTR
jgi:hypothetical protein